ncbi:ABC transporter substrate-binding protein [Agreia pratensis]|uniref:Osmoprotectant transport system substrate-binding protein n=1 Tax=Agreia pratensis TaxID=150121 RepID=A0A1X7L0I8_9MICO|nr:ABC transporter substrate-binding protein [Agreia pratensis]MBF4633747.1 ABC transporter substrate-binding protein [Agreia pratensis]SMG47014.1 osmoprotectant transport system substrate-binding protein [Agreia pratensis]
MFTANIKKGRIVASVIAVGAVVALAGCSTSDPLDAGSASTDSIVIGSQDYYSSEIIAEIYAQALEANDYTVDRQFRIGQREVYLPEIKAGKIDLFPEYTGSLLQALKPDTKATTSDEVYTELESALPKGLRVLDKSEASDQNSYTVTEAYAKENKLTDIASLKNVKTPIVVGGNAELETRPYGPATLKEKYGIDTTFQSIEDSGGPLTVKALVDNTIQLGNIYTADPNIKSNNLVALADPDGLFVADNIVPVASTKVDDKAAGIINKVSAALTEEDLVDLNAQSVNDQKSAEVIAKAWLDDKKLF